MSGQITFPGGDFFVVGAGDALPLSAEGEDPGSDDLTFTWSTGDVSDGTSTTGDGPDLDLLSPEGVFPFLGGGRHRRRLGRAGGPRRCRWCSPTTTVAAMRQRPASIVTGTADDAESSGWWKHQYSGSGSPHIDADTAQAYLDIVERRLVGLLGADGCRDPGGGACRALADRG